MPDIQTDFCNLCVKIFAFDNLYEFNLNDYHKLLTSLTFICFTLSSDDTPMQNLTPDLAFLLLGLQPRGFSHGYLLNICNGCPLLQLSFPIANSDKNFSHRKKLLHE